MVSFIAHLLSKTKKLEAELKNANSNPNNLEAEEFYAVVADLKQRYESIPDLGYRVLFLRYGV